MPSPWWYRKQFAVPASYKGKTVWLKFNGINYRANIFLNGKQIAKSDDVAGAWRTYEFNITGAAKPGAENVLAVQVFAPTEHDLAITFVDWNPAPPDKNMGLWREVYVTTSGPVALRYPTVVSKLNLPASDMAQLTVTAQLIYPGREGSMRIGLTGAGSTADRVVEQAKRAEADGFTSMWYPSAAGGGDPLAAMTLAGRATSAIELGTAVLVTYTCHPVLQASRANAAVSAIGRRGGSPSASAPHTGSSSRTGLACPTTPRDSTPTSTSRSSPRYCAASR